MCVCVSVCVRVGVRVHVHVCACACVFNGVCLHNLHQLFADEISLLVDVSSGAAPRALLLTLVTSQLGSGALWTRANWLPQGTC